MDLNYEINYSETCLDSTLEHCNHSSARGTGAHAAGRVLH